MQLTEEELKEKSKPFMEEIKGIMEKYKLDLVPVLISDEHGIRPNIQIKPIIEEKETE